MGRKPRNYRTSLRIRAGACIACLLALAVAETANAKAAGSGSWEKLKASPVAREGATATLLPDGKVLLAGGDEAGTSELFDPAENRWEPTGAMITTRSGHRATALSDGRVLVTGGLGKKQGEGADQIRPTIEAAEIYDPKAGRWSPAGSVAPGRFGHVSVALVDGRVLIAGGRVGGHDPTLADSSLFDPTTGNWSPAGSLGSGRSNFAATKLKDGRVLVTGGWPGGHSESRADAEIFDPGSAVWTQAGHLMGARRASHTSTLLADGRVLIAGGSTALVGGGFAAALASAEIFDPETGDFKATPPMQQRRMEHTATFLGAGKVLLTGFFGRFVDDKPTAPAEIYDSVSNTWTASSSIITVPGFHDAMLLEKGCGRRCGSVLLVGVTEDAANRPSNLAQIFRQGAAGPGSSTPAPGPAKTPAIAVWAGVAAAVLAAGFLAARVRRRPA